MIVHRLRLEANLEDKPEDRGHCEWEEKCPDNTEVRAEKAGLEVTFGKFDYYISAGEKLGEERKEHPDTVHELKTPVKGEK